LPCRSPGAFPTCNICVTIASILAIREYLDEQGESPFGRWFQRLNAPAAARITTALVRIGQGNLSNAKSVGGGVMEHRIDFGPGYRVYFGNDGQTLVILLAGTKARQQRDIETARLRWQDYRRRRREEK
jgi:putative addiction module killer protein